MRSGAIIEAMRTISKPDGKQKSRENIFLSIVVVVVVLIFFLVRLLWPSENLAIVMVLRIA